MTYRRVIPRDLFNEASLLKCLGQLYLKTERFQSINPRPFLMLHTGPDWNIVQDESDGSIYASAVSIIIGGVTYDHHRPLNARDPWPLYVTPRNWRTPGIDRDDDDEPEPLEVFEADGSLSPHFAQLIVAAVPPVVRCVHDEPLGSPCPDCEREIREATA